MISINNLHAEVQARQSKRYSIYEEVFQKVVSRIKYENSKTETCTCTYKLPVWVFGVPLYNLSSCADYIIRRLQEHLFIVSFYPPNILFISWNALHIQSGLQHVNNTIPGGGRQLTITPKTSLIAIQDAKHADINPSKHKQSIFDEIDKTFLDKSSNIIKPPINTSRDLNKRMSRPTGLGLNVDDFRNEPVADLDDILAALD